MSQSRLRRAVVALTALPLLALGAGQAVAAPAPTPAPAPAASKVTAIEDEAARTLAASLADPALRARLRTATAETPAYAELAPLAEGLTGTAARTLAATAARADRSVAAAKGLGADLGPLLRVQLADPSMRAALDSRRRTAGGHHAAPTNTPAPSAPTTPCGRAHTLDARTLPTRPVYLVDLDTAKALTAGIDLLQRELAARGVGSAAPSAPSAPTTQAAMRLVGHKITSVEVNDDEEPWFKGAAEMFSLVSGFGLDGKVRVDSVAMPYLQYDGTVYYPNQILVNWSNYKYNLADVVLMEDDGDTNYLALAQAVAAVLLTIADQGAYIPLVNAVLAALPSSWWTDDPDYVESWYTLARTSTGRLNGARGNGWMTVEPYWVSQL